MIIHATFQGNRRQAREAVGRYFAALVGRAVDDARTGESVLTVLGLSALSDIKDAFIEKSRGGTDEMGIKWPDLAPETIARRRVGPRDKRNEDIKRRAQIEKREFAKLFRRFKLSLPEAEAQTRARAAAAKIATRETGKTKVATLGGRDVEMLRDTGVLFNSLSPGRLPDPHDSSPYTPPEGQIFDIRTAEVVVGTNVPYANTHDKGDPSRGIPRRQFLPERGQVPAEWLARWTRAATAAMLVGLQRFLNTEH